MFIPRHPVVENQFCSYGASGLSTGVGAVVCYAGSVVYLNDGTTSANANQEPIVYKMSHGVKDAANAAVKAFGFAMQKVKTGYHQVHPTGFSMPGDLGSSDVIAQPSYGDNGDIDGTKEAPLGVAHMGIWDTVHYTCDMADSIVSGAILPGQSLFPAADEAKVTNNVTDTSSGTPADNKANGTPIGTPGNAVAVAVVVKGVSIAKAQANFNNTTLYPIRMKILV